MEEKIIYTIEFEGSDALIAELAKIRKENDELKTANSQYVSQLRNNKTANNEVALTYEKNVIQIKKNNSEINKLTTAVRANSGEIKTGRARLTELKKALHEMALAGDTSSEAFIRMRREASKTKNAIDDVNAEVNVFSQDAMVMNTVADSAMVVGESFQFIQGAQALLGIESENFQKIMTNMIAVQGMLNAAQGITNRLQADGNIILNIKKAKTAAVTKVTNTMTVAQNMWTAAKVKGAAAMALLLIKVTLVIAALAAIGGLLYLVFRRQEDHTKGLDSATIANEKYNDSIAETNRLIESRREKNKHDIDLMSAQGKTQDQIREKRINDLEKDMGSIENTVDAHLEHFRNRLIAQGHTAADVATIIAHERRKMLNTDEYKTMGNELEILNAERTQSTKVRNEKEISENTKTYNENKALNQKAINDEKLNRAKLDLILDDSLENQIALVRANHAVKLSERTNMSATELALEEEMLNNEIIKLKEIDEQAINDKLNREELANAELMYLQNNSLENRIHLETIKHLQHKESRNNWTVSELEAMNIEHANKIAALTQYYTDSKTLMDNYWAGVALSEEERKEAERLIKEEETLINDEQWLLWLEKESSRNMSELDANQQKLDKLEKLRKDDLISEEVYNKAKEALSIERTQLELENTQKGLRGVGEASNILSTIWADNADAQLAFSLFNQKLALFDAGIEMSKGLGKSASIGFPQNIIAIAGFVAQTAGLLASIRNAKAPKGDKPKANPPRKFADGGFIGGKPHILGGTKYYGDDGNIFEAERGEYLAIINKRDANRAAMFDKINSEHGVSLNTGGDYFARGGSVMPFPRQDFEKFDMNTMVREIVEEIAFIPVINDVRQTRDVMRRVNNMENSGNLN